jgi:hypothetical protein
MAARVLVYTRRELEHVAGIYIPVAIAVASIVLGAILFVLVRVRRHGDDLPRQQQPAA